MHDFTLEDMKHHLEKFAKHGLMQRMMRLLPGMGELTKMMHTEDTAIQLIRMVGIINAMTPQERREPLLITSTRCERIASGAGVSTREVGSLLTQFETMKRTMGNMGLFTDWQPRIRRGRRNDDLWN